MATVLPGDSDSLIDPLVAYLAELNKWNAAYNLTAVRNPADMVARHILDSLTVLPYLRGKRILDAGTGAGLPGIPLALSCPDRQFTLLDSNGKKVRFVQHAVATLRLHNVDVVQARAETLKPDAAYDCVVSRAFCSLADFVANSAHLLLPGGCLLAMKGRRPDAELATLPAGWRAAAVDPVAVPGLDGERHIVVLAPAAVRA